MKNSYIPVNNSIDKALAFAPTLSEAFRKTNQRITTKPKYIETIDTIENLMKKGWNIDGVCENSGSVILYNKDGTCISLLEEHADPICKETVLSKTTILERVAAKGGRFPIFIDLGCNTFAGKNSKTLWEEIKASYPKGPIGGRKTRRKLTKRPKVKKLIHFA